MKKLFLPLLLVLGITATAQVKVGDNPTTIGASSLMELENPNKALLLTRVQHVEDVSTPVNGMIVYENYNKCIRSYENQSWSNCLSGAPAPGYIPNNATCTNDFISKTACSKVARATINDDPASTLGIEYDWADATSTTLGVGFGSSTNVRALVEIGGQCWAKFNSSIVNTAANGSDNAVFYSGGPYGDEGLLYNWSAAMNSATVPAGTRSQGVCPVSWHIPSDCEYMFLENTIGMSTTQQQTAGGPRLINSALMASGSNSTGFSGLYSGQFSASGFQYRTTNLLLWTSQQGPFYYRPWMRDINTQNGGINRTERANGTAFKQSVRCLKD